jgi:hypothetical protein
MLLPYLMPWLNRLLCGLLIATIIAPEVRCCCNISWGPAGLCQPTLALQKPVLKAKCSCCTLPPSDALPDAQEFRDGPASDCLCTFQIAVGEPSVKKIGLEFPADGTPAVVMCLPDGRDGHGPFAAGMKQHPPSRTAQEHCALFQIWRT